jgi:hypothetical protein
MPIGVIRPDHSENVGNVSVAPIRAQASSLRASGFIDQPAFSSHARRTWLDLA